MVAKVNICILVVEARSVLMICYAFLHFPQWTKNFKSMYIIASLSGPKVKAQLKLAVMSRALASYSDDVM